MEPHHVESIKNLTKAFEAEPTALALILGGSIAHGFEKPDSDIDVTIVVDPAEYQARVQSDRLHYNNRELCTYEKGYIDGKYVDVEFLRRLAERGSDPARYAYHGSRILFSRVAGLEQLLVAITRYPVEQKGERIERFIAQLLAWRWYYSEALRQESTYLLYLALHKLVLFGGRIVLAHNALFFPYHKWLLRVLERAPDKPAGFDEEIRELLIAHSWAKVDAYCQRVLAFAGVPFERANALWPTRFMKDTELRWVHQEPCIDDL